MRLFGIPGSFNVNKGENMFAKASKKQNSSNGWRDFCVTIATVSGFNAQWQRKVVGLFYSKADTFLFTFDSCCKETPPVD